MFIKAPVTLTVVTNIDGRIVDLPTAIMPQGAAWDPFQFQLELVPEWAFYAAILVVLAFIALFVRLAFGTDLIRDPDRPRRADGQQPFSLSRTQMAFWFLLIACSYIFLFSATGKLSILNNTSLVLIGIGSGTALGAAVIGSGRQDALPNIAVLSFPPGTSRTDMEKQLADTIHSRKEKLSFSSETSREDMGKELEKAISELTEKKTKGTLDKDEETRLSNLKTLKDLLAQKDAIAKITSNPVLKVLDDLVSDNLGKYSFHRYQMLVWTLILCFVFVHGVVVNRTIPDFDSTTLALLGISAGTYLGFKLPAVTK
jgi:hypothetical protein